MDAARIRRAVRRLGCGVLAAGAALALAGCTLGASEVPTRKIRFALGEAGYASAQAVPEKPLAVVHTDQPGLDFELYVLRRSGKAVDVVFALHNVTGTTMDLDGPSQDLERGSLLAGSRFAVDVALVDGQHLKEYLTFLVGDDQCLCTKVWQSSERETLKAHQRAYGMAQVAAPPTDVTTVTVLAGTLASVPGARIGG